MIKKFIVVAVLLTLACSAFLFSWSIKKWFGESNQRSSAPCVNRLIVINGCKQQWALEYQKKANDLPKWTDIRPYLPNEWTNTYWTNGHLICQEGGTYELGKVSELPTCSIGGPRHSIPH